MASLPSYREATARPHWLDLAAPSVRFADYRRLCLVSRRAWTLFAPRLWGNLLKAVRLAGLDPGDDVSWWLHFVFNRLAGVRPGTRALVRVLDARGFAKDAYDFSSDQRERTLQRSIRHALGLLANVESVLLDGHADLDPGFLVGPSEGGAQHRPLLLSIAHCPFQLSNTFFASESLQAAVYLDVSGVPGSVWPLIQPGLLPGLRILKLRGREMDDATVGALVSLFKLRLWSLDLSDNRITDAVIDTVCHSCFPVTSLRTDARFAIEGKLMISGAGTVEHGLFVSIEDSEWSSSFGHPDRFLVDPPVYVAEPQAGLQEHEVFRSDGRRPVKHDTADAAVKMLSGIDGHMAAVSLDASRGITHLHLSGNQVSAAGIEKLLRVSNGQLEHVACDVMPLLPSSVTYPSTWPRLAKLYGILGAAHVFRPVFSSNLRSLRMHHSLVTNVPTLAIEGLSTLARIHLAEMAILPRVELAYPQTLVPDMNPRLASLTLTGIPRRSSGPVIERLIGFLKTLAVQERDIQEASPVSSSRRRPGMLRGLRHLRLEFDPDPMEDGFSTMEDLDAEELMKSGERGFSFFEDEWNTRSPAEGAKPASGLEEAANSSARDEIRRVDSDGDSDRGDEFVTYDGRWNGRPFSIFVWAGFKAPGSNAVVDEYRRLVVECNMCDGVGPVSPAQILAGAPERSYMFHTPWRLAIMPPELATPATSVLAGMRDVLDELKKYRLAGRAKFAELKKLAGGSRLLLGEPHHFWTGNLEVSTEQAMPLARPAHYWR